MAFGWTKYLTPVLLSPRLQGSVIGVILTAILTFFTMPRTQVSENSAQFLTKNVGDKLAEEMRQRLIKEIDALAKSDEFKKAVAKAIEDTKAANEKK
jgi:hypothetical protein